VIGDKRGTATAIRLAGDRSVLERVRQVVGVPIRVVQHSRNPFDTIATAARAAVSGEEPPKLSPAIRWYESWSDNLALVRPQLRPGELFDSRHERLVADPRQTLAEICGFLGVEAEPTFLEQCAATVWPSPRLSRQSVSWTDEQIERVDRLIAGHDWLVGYQFAEEPAPVEPEET
jgi:hypothetical protein